MSRQALAICAMLVLASPLSASATVLWNGDFQTGDLSQWGSAEEAASNRVQIVTSPLLAGDNYTMSATVQPGDVVFDGARAELDYTNDSPAEGDVRYYHWQTYFPSDFNPAPYWQIFTQWHQYVTGGSPPLAIMVWGNQIKLGNEQDVYFYTGPLTLGVWHDFIVHVLWSTDSTVGGVEMWMDGVHVLAFTNVATLFPNDTIYLKQGLYRSMAVTYAQTIYHCGMTVATTLADVMPNAPDAGPPPPVDAGTPDAGPPPPVDAGSPDAGGGHHDAGEPPVDAGMEIRDAGEISTDAGSEMDADSGTESTDGGRSSSGGGGEVPHHHSCNTAGPSWALIGLAALLRRCRP